MVAISYLCRRGARYHYRRRLYLRKIVNAPITVPLGTADPGEARRLVARLSVRWDQIAMQAYPGVTRGFLKADELSAVFREGLEEELALATAPMLDVGGSAGIDGRCLRVFEAAYRIAAKIPSDATIVPETLLAEQTADFNDQDRDAVLLMLKTLAPHRSAKNDADRILRSIGAPVSDTTLRDARVQVLLAKAEAQARATLISHPRIAAAGNPLARLLDDEIVTAVRAGPQPAPQSATQEDSPFLTQDTRRFSEVIDATIASIQRSGDWNEDIAQRKRVIQGFCWITGNKRLCDYRPADPRHFADTLLKLPTSFRWGTPEEGNMSRPFAEVMAEVERAAAEQSCGTERSVRTYNRDLTTMARFARELTKDSWKPRFGKDPIIDFNEFAAAAPEDDPNDPDRMPWTDQQLITAFSSPIYTGGGGCARRFKKDPNGSVWQDAAYWVPLLLTYGILTREEACGLECQDVVFDVSTPFLVVKANMTKSKDGKKAAGIKRAARHRMIPLHPELLRLGFRAYVDAIEAEGHRMLFPELYREGLTNRGGKRFYASAGRYLLDYVDGITPLLRTSAGKRADLHSMRTAGGSALEASDTKQLMVNDIMGHAREGVGPRKYSKAWFAQGGDKILAERLKAMVKAIPSLTGHLKPAPIRFLPIEERSRTGSAVGSASRRKA